MLFWVLSLFVKKESVPFKDLLLLFGASMFGIVINQFAFLEGLSRSSVIDTGILLTITPIITMLFAALFLKEPITGRKILGVWWVCQALYCWFLLMVSVWMGMVV